MRCENRFTFILAGGIKKVLGQRAADWVLKKHGANLFKFCNEFRKDSEKFDDETFKGELKEVIRQLPQMKADDKCKQFSGVLFANAMCYCCQFTDCKTIEKPTDTPRKTLPQAPPHAK